MTRFTILLSVLFLFAQCQNERTIERGLITDNAMVVSAHPLASEIGKEILKSGGNAVDAAIAVQFALAVCYPEAGNIGGGGFMIVREQDGNSHALDFREKAPEKAHRDLYLDDADSVIQELSLNTHLAVGVPGTVDGMVKAHQKFGSKTWEELIQPSIELALNGVVLTDKEASKLNKWQEVFAERNPEDSIFSIDKNWNKGDVLIQKDLSNTLTLIKKEGEYGFYAGEVAKLLVREMESGNGIITLDDLLNYEAVWREPIQFNYDEDYSVISMCPPSSGGIALGQLMKMSEHFPFKGFQHNGPVHINAMTEIERRVYADRASHLGDPDYYNVPVNELLDQEYLKDRISSIRLGEAGTSKKVDAGVFTKESEQTTHYSIVDKDGMAVSVTTTLNLSFGSKIIVEGAGFFLNNEMDDFSSKPGTPNFYGLIGAEGNAIEPGKRMLSSMTPTIVEKDNKLFMVVGTPGGSTIITSVYQNIMNVINFEMGMQESVNAKRVHHQWLPDAIIHETGSFSEDTKTKLSKMGYTFMEREAIGKVDAILVLPDGRLEAGADPRGDDCASGY